MLKCYNDHKEEIKNRIGNSSTKEEKSNILPVVFEQDYLDYQDLITYYIMQIHRDHEHYKALRKDPNEIISFIRMFNRESQLLLRVKLWWFYHCKKDNKWLEQYEARKTARKES